MEYTIDKLKESIIEALEYENQKRLQENKRKEINIPFAISSIDQHIRTDDYYDFIKDIHRYDFQVTFENYDDGWLGYGKLVINLFTNIDEGVDYRYTIELSRVQRHWGYCQCASEDDDFRNDKDCCGHGCDWNAPAFRLIKEVFIGGEQTWEGDEHDYWDYEDAFYKTNEELAIEKERLEREDKIKHLKVCIQEKQKELELLLNI